LYIIYINMHIYIHIHIYICIYTRIPIFIYTYTYYLYIHTCIYVYVCIYICICIYIFAGFHCKTEKGCKECWKGGSSDVCSFDFFSRCTFLYGICHSHEGIMSHIFLEGRCHACSFDFLCRCTLFSSHGAPMEESYHTHGWRVGSFDLCVRLFL